MDHSELENRFRYHVAAGEQPLKFAAIRGECLGLARLMAVLIPEGRERDIAIEKLEEAMFWANAGIAREHGEG